MENKFNSEECKVFVERMMSEEALPSIIEYIKIPNLSRAFDNDWKENGLLLKAANHIKSWVQKAGIKGLTTEIIHKQGLSPLIFTEVQGQINETVLFYGHYDKQPPFEGWMEGLGPYTPVILEEKLYGRGGADDGYATYSTMTAIKSLQEQGLPLPRCIMITEGDEQSGSAHMSPYLELLKERIGSPSLIFCLDSGTLDYQRLWVTNSLRGVLAATLRVDVLTEGVHSGDASGVVPSPFRILRELIQRLETSKYGDIHDAFQVDIPANRYKEMYDLVSLKQKQAVKEFPFLEAVQTVSSNPLTSVINRGWKPQLSIIGASGLPQCKNAGNVMLPFCELKLSIRLPPTKNSKEAEKQFVKILTEYPPYNAKVTISNIMSGTGFNAPKYSDSLQNALKEASQVYYGNPKLAICEGMSIPLLGLMQSMFPNSQFIVTGLLGPKSNAHGPNEFMHIPYLKKLTMCMAHVLAKYYQK